MKLTSIDQPFSLRRNFSWTLVGNIFYSACQGGMLIVLARLGTPEMVGAFTFALAVTAPLFMFSNLQLRVVQATDAQAQYTFNDYLGLRLASTLLVLCGLLAMNLLFPSSYSTVILIIGVAKAVESISDVCAGFLQQQERMDFISISLMIKGSLSLLLLAMGIVLTGQVMGGAIGLTIAWAMVLIGYDLRVMQRLMKRGSQDSSRLKPRWKWQVQQKLIRLTLPLGAVMLLISLNANIPQYLIQYFIVRHSLHPADLGIFAAIAYLMLVGSIIQGALAQAASPRLAKYYAEGQRKAFVTLLFNLLGIGVVIGGMGIGMAWMFGKPLLTLIYTAQYGQYSHLLVWLMGAAALEYLSSFLGTAITSARYFRVQVPLFATSVTMMAIASFILIPIQGLIGIPLAMIMTAFLRILLCVAVLAHALKQCQSPEPTPALL